jgi:IclR family mhp operon transcriptional activator
MGSAIPTAMPASDSSPDSSVYKHVQGLSRGLAILRALCDCADGRAQIPELSARTDIHRTTVRRLLETLVLEGLVQSSEDDGAYFLTAELKRWGDAFTTYDHVAELAAPILDELSARITWPCSLATPQEDTMIIRAATHHQSPLSFHRRTLGRRLPMLMTSMGRAYLAFSNASTRDRILDLIASKYEAGEVPLISLATFKQIMLRTQRDGYGANHGEWSADKKVAAIAVPVMNKQGAVLACINVVAITRATSPDQLAKKFLAQLRDAATEIEVAIAQSESKVRKG